MINLTTLRLFELGEEEASPVKLHLTKELTPNLVDLEIRNLPESCDFKVLLPTLKRLRIEYYHPERDALPINEMLAAATGLEQFGSYKLWVSDELRFASNHLRRLRIYRSDCLSSVSIWAPNLDQLYLQCCWDLENVKLLTSHPTLSQDLPRDHEMSTITVHNGDDLEPSQMQDLLRSRRCVFADEEETRREWQDLL